MPIFLYSSQTYLWNEVFKLSTMMVNTTKIAKISYLQDMNRFQVNSGQNNTSIIQLTSAPPGTVSVSVMSILSNCRVRMWYLQAGQRRIIVRTIKKVASLWLHALCLEPAEGCELWVLYMYIARVKIEVVRCI